MCGLLPRTPDLLNVTVLFLFPIKKKMKLNANAHKLSTRRPIASGIRIPIPYAVPCLLRRQ